MWDTIERLWSDAVARVERLPDPARDERVDDEWSFAQTLRHLDARPSFAEVLAVRADRMAPMRGIVDGLSDGDLDRICTRTPAPGHPEEPHTAGRCLRVVMNEECEHYRYAARDLAVLESRPSS